MKTLFLYKKGIYSLTAVLFSLTVLMSACSKSYNNNNNNGSQNYTTAGNASGSQENPPVSSSGSGSLVGTYDAYTNVWNYSVNWSSLSSAATVIEFHGPADVGVDGSLVFSLTIAAGGTNGAASGSVTLTEQQEAYLLANRIYYTIIDAAHVTGEIRGQVYTAAQ